MQWTKIDDCDAAFNMKTQLSYVGYDRYTVYCVEVDIFNFLLPVFFMQISPLNFIAVMLSGKPQVEIMKNTQAFSFLKIILSTAVNGNTYGVILVWNFSWSLFYLQQSSLKSLADFKDKF